jgi:hypothetical protein
VGAVSSENHGGLGAPRVAGEEMGQVGGPDLLRRKVFFRNLFNHFQST